ncbi:hypothetical protein LG59_2289 [Serratia ureilytica]|uniref:hypothetical protein n=1 Tax=Serratia ureilytica TaxID=300181 RepID=UPI000627BE0D|nr:hypothetical protein [Serratia ureilytica]KKO58346.1 hypothetical protein LG59_2289 [Serratia ureilytica]
MSTEKLSELSKPVQIFKHPSGRNFWSVSADSNAGQQDVEAFYSQEYVSSLDKVAQYWIGESAGWKKRAEDAEKRIAELEEQKTKWVGWSNELGAKLDAAEKRLAESRETTLLVRDEWQKEKERADAAEKRLATSVRLPAKVSAQDMRETFNYLMDAEEAQAAANGFNQGLMESRKLLHEQGFTVEGDE